MHARIYCKKFLDKNKKRLTFDVQFAAIFQSGCRKFLVYFYKVQDFEVCESYTERIES